MHADSFLSYFDNRFPQQVLHARHFDSASARDCPPAGLPQKIVSAAMTHPRACSPAPKIHSGNVQAMIEATARIMIAMAQKKETKAPGYAYHAFDLLFAVKIHAHEADSSAGSVGEPDESC